LPNLLDSFADEARKKLVLTSFQTSTPHVSSSLSCLDILLALHWVARETNFVDHDFYLSKGHAALSYYAVLEVFGRIDQGSLNSYCRNGSSLEGHINSRIDGVPLSTGSLGHAFPFAIGRAIGDRKQHWVILSDGELNEGSNWEALLLAGHLSLKNLNIVVDRNSMQSFGPSEETIRMEPLRDKLESFGWKTLEVDGHNYSELVKTIRFAEDCDTPMALVALTKKGHGVIDIEKNATLYHYRPATREHIYDLGLDLSGEK
jgi:transketolase